MSRIKETLHSFFSSLDTLNIEPTQKQVIQILGNKILELATYLDPHILYLNEYLSLPNKEIEVLIEYAIEKVDTIMLWIY